MTKKGFTLIELLVVIAIIGILASIVLVSLGSARKQAKDAAIKGNMDAMRLAAEMEYTENLSYSGATARTDYGNASANVTTNLPTGGALTENFSADAYCIQADLNDGTDWCLDSTGYAGGTANCDATNYDCAS